MTDQQLSIAPDLDLPLEAVTETFAILAKRGKGKTNTAVVMAEEMIGAGIPVVVLDPVGVWWGIRSSADGAGEGLPVVIFGGDHADVPLEEKAGDLIADVVVDRRMSAVIDLSSLSKSASRRFMGPFVERLYHRNREALHVIVDEADAFAPQRPQADGARLLGAMEDLVRRGRARGIGVTLITQRPAVLNKDVLTQAEVLVALGMTGVRDVAAIDEWVRLHADDDQARQVKASLPSLQVGDAWVWSPGWLDVLQRVHVRARRTFDSSATPKPGEKRVTPQRLADVDLAALGEQITATVERAKADDPRELRRRIAQLEREVEQLRDAEPDVEHVEVPAVTDELLQQFREHAIALRDTLEEIGTQLVGLVPPAPRATEAAPVPPAPRTAGAEPRLAQRQRERPPRAGDVTLRAGARRMVETLGRMHPLRLTKGQWGTVAGLKTTGGTWSTYLGEIRRLGFIDEDHAGFTLTEAGFDYLGGRPDPMTAPELQDHYRSILRAGAAKMLDALIEAYPTPLSNDELGEAAGIATTGGTFSTYRGELVRNGLAERSHRGGLVATEILIRGADQ
ncbi:ATP-binding protein [Nocardioides marmoraquaticus]